MMSKPNSTGFRNVEILQNEESVPLEKYEDMAFNQAMRADYTPRTPTFLSEGDPHGHLRFLSGAERIRAGQELTEVIFSSPFQIPPMVSFSWVTPNGTANQLGTATSNGEQCQIFAPFISAERMVISVDAWAYHVFNFDSYTFFGFTFFVVRWNAVGV
jgi:hypothetical protein